MIAVEDLLAYIDASPSPYHAVETTVGRLAAAGFVEARSGEPLPEGGGHWFVRRGGALVAWSDVVRDAPDSPFRLVGAHTDSPNLRIKPRPDIARAGFRQLGVEVYGGALWNSWLDRDLGLSGRVVVAGDRGTPDTRLFRVDDALLRIPQLAIHLDRDVNGAGLKLNPQTDLTPVWGLGTADEGDFAAFLADQVGAGPGDVLAWDVMVHDLTPATRLGRAQELVAAPRIDNLLSCWAGTEALIATGRRGSPPASTPVLCLFDHEEVGSTSATGADGALLASVLEQVVAAGGGDRAAFLRAMARSVCASADGAHATHPNRPERHDPDHQIAIDGGPVIKVNANQRYASDAETVAVLVDAARRAEVPHQVFVSRNDQPCGSTIGPLTAARLGIATVDVGAAQLSMHSARELCGAEDPPRLTALLAAFLGD